MKQFLNQAKNLLSKISNLHSEGFVFYRLGDTTIIEINDAFAGMFGFKREEMLGKPIAELGIEGWGKRRMIFQKRSKEKKFCAMSSARFAAKRASCAWRGCRLNCWK